MPCTGCSKLVRYSAARARRLTREGRALTVFCSRRCNQHYVASEGTKQQVKLIEDEFKEAMRDQS